MWSQTPRGPRGKQVTTMKASQGGRKSAGDAGHAAGHDDEQLATRQLRKIWPDEQRRLDHADEDTMLDRLIAEIVAFTGDARFDDDICALTVEAASAAGESAPVMVALSEHRLAESAATTVTAAR